MRFLADMGVGHAVLAWLRGQGHDVVHLREQGLHRLPDSDIFTKAIAEDRIIITFDLDFGEILAGAAGQQVSVILFRLHNTRSPHVIERLEHVLPDVESALAGGAIVIIEEARHRIRTLPIK